MRRAVALALLTVVAALAAAASAGAQTPPAPAERIRAGVTVSGVDVGNLTVAQAKAELAAELAPVASRGIAIVAGGRRFTLKPSALGYKLRPGKSALRALYAGQHAPAAADGTLPPASATPSVRYSRKPLWRFVRGVGAKVGRAARDARVRITVTHIYKRPGRKGKALKVRPIVEAAQRILADPTLPRAVVGKLVTTTPRVRTRELKRAYPTIITISRSSFQLRLYRNLRFSKRYGVAVGMPAYPTPTGLFAIQSKQVDPTWTAPNSPWAGEMAGQQVAGGAIDNPLKARWMGVAGSVGIHGTGQPWTIGSQASHGCIRMSVPDVIDLFGRVSIGTPVLIR